VTVEIEEFLEAEYDRDDNEDNKYIAHEFTGHTT